jgi:hypothetical protein
MPNLPTSKIFIVSSFDISKYEKLYLHTLLPPPIAYIFLFFLFFQYRLLTSNFLLFCSLFFVIFTLNHKCRCSPVLKEEGCTYRTHLNNGKCRLNDGDCCRPDQAYELVVKWSVATGAVLADLVRSWASRAQTNQATAPPHLILPTIQLFWLSCFWVCFLQ